MNIKKLEKMLNKYEKVDASIICIKDSERHTITIEGSPIDVTYLVTELVRGLSGKIPTKLLRFAFELGIEDEADEE